MIYDVIVCGGGAAGFFSAINVANKTLKSKILILEKSSKLLAKVKISGGGRCNVTNGRELPAELVKFYPRGGKKLYALLKGFGPKEMTKWLGNQNVPLHTEADLRVFPISNNSQTIIDCFLQNCIQKNIEIKTNQEVISISKVDGCWELKSKQTSYLSKHVIFATGSSPKSWAMLQKTPIKMESPVPSLFTFNIKDERLNSLPGVSFEDVTIKVEGSKISESGPLLITHWGLSGPAVLKLSAWAARQLYEKNYEFNILINFNKSHSAESFRDWLLQVKQSNPHKKLSNMVPAGITTRYWSNLISYCNIPENLQLQDLSKKIINKLSEECTQAKFVVKGKSTFKEEFVTCGGISLSEIDLKTMESKHHTNLYFSGEVLNIDGITGGFNFQACWATGWAVSETISKRFNSL